VALWSLILCILIGGPVAGAQDDVLPEPDTALQIDDEVQQVEGDAASPVEASEEPEAPASPFQQLDGWIGYVNGWVFKTLFFDVSFGVAPAPLPFLVVWLAIGAVFYTFYHGWINIRGFGHAWNIVRGKYQTPGEAGEIAPFQALTSALSATVGLGNIAGVAIAMATGGPGALFWMMFLGLFGMTAKFHESTLAQLFRRENPDGSISGGPMYYLDHGIRQHLPALAWLGKVLAVVFAIFLMGASLGGGNMFQANQAFEAFFVRFIEPAVTSDPATTATQVDAVRTGASIGFGLLMAVIVGVVVIGGIRRIGTATAMLVPFMAGLYVAACAFILLNNATLIPNLIAQVLGDAFALDSAFGGLLGAMMVGFQRAAFSSESGIGSSAVAHSAARTAEPVREGLVASLEPFIDTIVICFMTGMVVLITGVYLDPDLQDQGVAMTLAAFEQRPVMQALQFPSILSICVVLFAFSTMISWCYYGERAWGYLFGDGTVLVFRLAFVVCVFIGSVISLGAVLDSADAMLLSCALPNILGGILLAPLVRRKAKDYWRRYKAGEFLAHKGHVDVHTDSSHLGD
jgi:AGCS family alanine or glycine:cation symporter